MNVPLPPKHFPIYVAQNEKGEVTDHIVMARRKSPAIHPTNHQSENK